MGEEAAPVEQANRSLSKAACQNNASKVEKYVNQHARRDLISQGTIELAPNLIQVQQLDEVGNQSNNNVKNDVLVRHNS